MTAPAGVAAAARPAWSLLAGPRPEPGRFDPAVLIGLPEPVARWLAASIEPGARLHHRAALDMDGEIRLGAWRPFTARQVLAPPEGLVWAARAQFGPLPVTGFDSFAGGRGRMRWRLLGAVPVVSAAGPDVTRSAAGRLAGEALVLPSCALAPWVTWRPVDGRSATADVSIGSGTHPVTVVVDDRGRLESASLPRWDGTTRRERSFGVRFADELAVAGMRLPGRLTAGWDWDGRRWAEGAFFRARLRSARLF